MSRFKFYCRGFQSFIFLTNGTFDSNKISKGFQLIKHTKVICDTHKSDNEFSKVLCVWMCMSVYVCVVCMFFPPLVEATKHLSRLLRFPVRRLKFTNHMLTFYSKTKSAKVYIAVDIILFVILSLKINPKVFISCILILYITPWYGEARRDGLVHWP